LLRPRTRWAICWLIFLTSAAIVAEQTWKAFDQPGRGDGNAGHATIDFGGQWLMGRMIVEGQGRHLYDRRYLRPVAHNGYPAGVERAEAPKSDPKSPKESKGDAESLMDWLSGTDDSEAPRVIASFLAPLAAQNELEETTLFANAQTTWKEERLAHVTAPRIGGGLYPPVHALYYAPLSLLRPRITYRVIQGVILVLVFFAGWVIQRMTEGRVWWPVASLFIMMFPGFSGCITLGQNGMFTLTVVLVGWWQLMRGREVLAGLCWGLLAFKPVWAAAFFLVPLVTARRRMAASMALAGLMQIALTLPIVGWESWRNWLQVGQDAAQEYKRQENWIVLSRDLLGIPRRWLLTFEGALAKDLVWRSGDSAATDDSNAEKPWDHPLLSILGWGAWEMVLAATLFVVWRRWQRRNELTGAFPAFVLSGCILTCYHFMYYDFVVAVLPVLLLFTEPARYFQLQFWRWPRWLHRSEPRPSGSGALSAEMRRYYQPSLMDLSPPPMPLLPRGRRPRWVAAPMPPLLLFLMLVLPAYCGIRDPSYHFPPWDTFVLLFLWAWCGYRLLKRGEGRGMRGEKVYLSSLAPRPSPLAPQGAELGTNVGGTHERLTDQHSADAGHL